MNTEQGIYQWDELNNVIVIHVEGYFKKYQELGEYFELFFHRHPDCRLIDQVVGADRESARFSFEDFEYVLHIESYSESIWIESVLPAGVPLLKTFTSL